MTQYMHAIIYKKVPELTPYATDLQYMIWHLFHLRNDEKATKEIYKHNFAQSDNNVTDLHMKFLGDEENLYQTNDGIPGVVDFPKLKFSFQQEFHDFWLAIIRPSEMKMNENDHIQVQLTGKMILDRFQQMEYANEKNKDFERSRMSEHFYDDLQQVLRAEDMVFLQIENIYEHPTMNYREHAKQCITQQRKKIADAFHIPHWAKQPTNREKVIS